jgi:adenine-specific DNA-methyltransferase
MFKIPYGHVIYKKNGDIFIRIPTSPQDSNVFHIVNSWSDTLKGLGFEISTGPIVPFRTRKYLLSEPDGKRNSTPLIWMHNMQGLKVVWPYARNGKSSAFVDNDETKCLLLPLKNYVLLRRFSSKEQKHRLHASVLLASELPYKNIAIENHVNYIYKPKGNLSVYEAFGLAALLNTTFLDIFFRSFSGSTQVNASDVKNLPCPNIEKIQSIGKVVYDAYITGLNVDIDQKVVSVVQMDPLVVKKIR